jgi:hypothetical protein
MARISYTSYRVLTPSLMDKELFDYLKGLPVKEGSIRYHPYEGFIKTFPGWCVFLVILAGGSVYMYFQGERDYWLPLIAWPAFALWTGGAHSMLSWLAYYHRCRSYYARYSQHINQARDYAELAKLRQGLHGEPKEIFS